MTREEAYDTVAKIAAEHALIAQGFGGVLTIVHPSTQRQHGIEAKCLYMAGQGPWPGDEQSPPDQASVTQHRQADDQVEARREKAQLDIFNDAKESAA